jgi:hypothetical protein
MATLLMALAGGFTLLLDQIPLWGKAGMLLTFAVVLTFIWTRPDGRPRMVEPAGP